MSGFHHAKMLRSRRLTRPRRRAKRLNRPKQNSKPRAFTRLPKRWPLIYLDPPTQPACRPFPLLTTLPHQFSLCHTLSSSFLHRPFFISTASQISPTPNMTTVVSNSSSPYDDDNIPTATLALPSAAVVSRRLPPPCWSPEETSVLIEAYKEKWYSLRRGNLRANHWQEVADDVASRFHSSPPKTAVQCRHKMEKLRKRYRAEIQRAVAHGGVRGFPSSWAHFQSMHAMEKGPNHRPSPPSTDDDEEEIDHKTSIKRINNLYNNQMGNFGNQGPVSNGAASGFRIKIPGMVTSGPAETKLHSGHNEIGGQNHYNRNPRFINSFNSGYGTSHRSDGYSGQNEMGKRVSEISKGNSGVSEMVEAVQALGEGFMRIEKVKMDMARQVEEMRMEMELKRTEMILESQQRIVEAFAKTISERTTKKAKRVSTPECSNGVGAR